MLHKFSPVEMCKALVLFLAFDYETVILKRNLFDFLILLIELIVKFCASNLNFRCYFIAMSQLHFIGRYFNLGFVGFPVLFELKRTLRFFLRHPIFLGLIAELFERKIALGFNA